MADLWPTLQAAALEHAHPSWFGGIEPALLERAQQSPWGRRLLARELSSHAAPVLFGSIPAAVPHSLSSEDWLQLPRSELDALLLDLAASAFSAPIRGCINRSDVLRLRRVLGEARYAHTLSHTASSGADADAINGVLARAMASDEGLHETLRARGGLELMKAALAAHPAAVERLRMHGAYGSAAVGGAAWLSADQVRSATALALARWQNTAPSSEVNPRD